MPIRLAWEAVKMMDNNRIHDVDEEEPYNSDREVLIRTLVSSATAGATASIIANRSELLTEVLDYLFLIALSLIGRQLGLWFAYRTITPEAQLLSLRTCLYGFLTVLLSTSGGLLYLILKLR